MTKIFYGAGNNAKASMEKWIGEGNIPQCFADADSRKWGTKFLSYDVISLYEVIVSFPDYELYLTQAKQNLSAVMRYLRDIGIPDDRIKALDAEIADDDLYHLQTTERLQNIYDHLGDRLSQKIFLGRLCYSVSKNLASVYEAMICSENMNWIETKHSYADNRYKLKGLWQILYEEYPKQKRRWYLLWKQEWFEYEWIVDRFLEAMSILGMKIEAIVVPETGVHLKGYEDASYFTEEKFRPLLSDDIRLIIGYPGWCLEIAEVVQKYNEFRHILVPIADTAHPQYIEPDILQPVSDEVFVDIGVFDLGNTVDFIEYANKGFKRIYGFEPDKKCYEKSKKNLALR